MSEVRPIPKPIGRAELARLTDAELLERFGLMRYSDPFLAEIAKRLSGRVEREVSGHVGWLMDSQGKEVRGKALEEALDAAAKRKRERTAMLPSVGPEPALWHATEHAWYCPECGTRTTEHGTGCRYLALCEE